MALAFEAPPLPRHVERLRHDGTTVHLARHPPGTHVRVVALRRPEPLAAWCARRGVGEALVGGFFVRPGGQPLGELRTAGVARAHVPFAAPWQDVRACVHVDGPTVSIARRPELAAAPRGDLLQAGPLLVRGGRVVDVADDPEGFSEASHQFDSDITEGRHPRAALGRTQDGTLLAVACDGRHDDEAGLGLGSLASLLASLGATDALNLDGGGSTSLVAGGELVNVPREQHGVALAGGRAVSTALLFA